MRAWLQRGRCGVVVLTTQYKLSSLAEDVIKFTPVHAASLLHSWYVHPVYTRTSTRSCWLHHVRIPTLVRSPLDTLSLRLFCAYTKKAWPRARPCRSWRSQHDHILFIPRSQRPYHVLSHALAFFKRSIIAIRTGSLCDRGLRKLSYHTNIYRL